MKRRPALRAPQENGALLAVPALEQAGRLARDNQQHLDAGPAILGRPWGELRRLARGELLALARGYLQERGEPLPGAPGPALVGPLFVAGHQPELFHPGVWLKNFALAGLARRHQGLAVNLLVDNDTLKSTALRLPVRAADGWPRLHALPFDHWHGEAPWEERRVADPDTFARFGDEAAGLMRHWGFEPLVTGLWPEVLRHGDEPIGEAFAAARRWLERRWGCHNLEAPLSRLSEGEAFAWFAGGLLAELPRFHADHNSIVAGYRARRRIRSRNHPVPDLAAEGDWLEAPLWGWQVGAGRRSRLFARRTPGGLALRTGQGAWPELPAPQAGERFAAAWRGLRRQGFKVRPRALATTLFARLFLADLFVHGIGGGIYDQLTDELMRRSFGVAAPAYLVLSGTLRLPLPAFPASQEDRRRLVRHVRDLRYNPQRHLSPEQAQRLADVLAQRQEWLARQPDSAAGRRQRFHELRALNDVLHAPLVGEQKRLEEDLARLDRELAGNAVLLRRDYSFCLYPEATLRPFLAQVL